MIWIRPDKEDKLVTWYSEDLIKLLKTLCLEREFLSSNVILKVIEDYENA